MRTSSILLLLLLLFSGCQTTNKLPALSQAEVENLRAEFHQYAGYKAATSADKELLDFLFLLVTDSTVFSNYQIYMQQQLELNQKQQKPNWYQQYTTTKDNFFSSITSDDYSILQPDGYGLGIHKNRFGQAVRLKPDFGYVPGEHLEIKTDGYGLGVHSDQYGRPVREKPWP